MKNGIFGVAKRVSYPFVFIWVRAPTAFGRFRWPVRSADLCGGRHIHGRLYLSSRKSSSCIAPRCSIRQGGSFVLGMAFLPSGAGVHLFLHALAFNWLKKGTTDGAFRVSLKSAVVFSEHLGRCDLFPNEQASRRELRRICKRHTACRRSR